MQLEQEPSRISAEQIQELAHGATPLPTSETREFWDATSRGEFVLPFCESCNRYFFYPRATCRYCHSAEVSWRPASGRGTLLSYVINHLPLPEFQTKEPQVIAIIELEEGVNFVSQIILETPTPEALELDMPLEVVFVPRGEIMLPFFVPAHVEEVVENA